MADSTIKALVSIEKIFYPKNTSVCEGDWASFTCYVDDVYEGDIKYNRNGARIMVKGIVPEINYFDKYILLGKYSYHETYGHQYEILCMSKYVDFEDPMEQRQFLERILTESQVNILYEGLADPFKAIKTGDMTTLTSVKGIGETTAYKIVQSYTQSLGNSLAYVELDAYGLTKYMIDKLVGHYGSADTLVKRIKENPYILIEEVDGIGWAKADAMALKGAGIDPTSTSRIEAYIVHYLKTSAEDGDTWVTPGEIVSSIYSTLEIEDDDVIRESLHDLYERGVVCWDEAKTRISLLTYYNLENRIANDLKRLMAAEQDFQCKDLGPVVKALEIAQGWDYTEEQLAAIKMVVASPVSIITGYGGTGKSSVVAGVLQILRDHSFAQTALSGRAASRLSEITNQDGYTIHRLLGYNPHLGFAYNRHNPLDCDIIILDETSMVGAELFYRLVQAIPSGGKLIMLGDDGQLESIGLCNIFKDMLDSGIIPVARLTKIHRQAAKSAIITESIKVRSHEQLVPYGWIGEEIRGELQDLELNIFSDDLLTQKRIVDKFVETYDRHPHINDIQIVVPMKYKGPTSTLALNEIIQDYVNPHGKNETSITIKDKNETYTYVLKEKDKVIVTKNNYKTRTVDDENCPVFNGNRGIIQSIDASSGKMIVRFEQWGDIVLKRAQWRSIALGYALSCHKLQGSEADYVIIGFDFSGRQLLTKEWLYTAITRAKKYCILCAETKALSYCILNTNVPYKRTFLRELLNGELKMQIAQPEKLESEPILEPELEEGNITA